MRESLPMQALRYAAGELPGPQAEAFEARLAHDAAAQDALAEAVRLSARALGQPAPEPDPLLRPMIAERLAPAPWWRGLFRRRPYRGHPLTWAGLGASAAGSLALGLWYMGHTPEPAHAPTPQELRILEPARTALQPPGGGGGAEPPHAPMDTTFLPPTPFPPGTRNAELGTRN